MKVIVIYKKYHDMEIGEAMPRVVEIKVNETPESVLRREWEDFYNGVLADNLSGEIDDPLDEENCWCEDEIALITWADKDTTEFYVIDVEQKEST